MRITNRLERLAVAGTIATAVAVGALAPVAHAEPDAPDVPSTIAVPEGHKVFLVGHAVGVQIYSCNDVAGAYRWGFVAPRADLFGDSGTLIATHFVGPTWQATDGSTVVGKLDAPPATVDQTAIPWLRLVADRAAAGPAGDRLARTTYIQRTATTGGLAPAAETCNASTVGTTAEVAYTADYHFWKATGR